MLYVQKRKNIRKKSEKTLYNFFHVGVIQGISLLKRPSRSSTLVTVMLLLLQCVDLARIHIINLTDCKLHLFDRLCHYCPLSSANLCCFTCLSKLFQLTLKEQCHGDFAVLGQFCAKIIYFEALIINKMLL